LTTTGVNDSLDMNFSIWAGILLASVAALVTTLGVVIAIGSVFGYKKIMDSSRKEAERVAKIELTKVAKKEIKERIERGEFNSLITEAVDRVAFGNINSNTELDDRRGEE
jgi:tRNA1(Val) A37 N6-methylase TrmN6